MRKLLSLPLCLGSFLAAQPGEKPLVSVSFFRVDPAKASQWSEVARNVYGPMMDGLVANGTVTAYGMDRNLFHDPESANYVLWYNVKDFNALGKAMAAIDELFEKNAAAMQPAMDAYDHGTHADALYRTVEAKAVPPKPGQMPYTIVSTFRAKPGKGDEMVQAFRSFYQPVYNKLVDDGALTGYALLNSVTHRNNIGEYTMVVEMPDLGGMDKIDAAFAAMMKEKSQEERNMIESMFEAVSEVDGHQDWIMKAVIYKAGP